MDSTIIKVAILDDHKLFREVLVRFLKEQRDISVDIDSSTFPELLEKLSKNVIDVLVLDLGLPDVSGEEVQRIIADQYPEIKTVVLSMFINYATINRLFDTGIYGFVSKAASTEELTSAIYSAANNKLYKNKILTEALLWSQQNKVGAIRKTSFLTIREVRIIQLLWEEKSNEEIAAILFLGIRSIEKIRQDIKEKTETRSTIGMIKYAISHNIITVNQYSMKFSAGDERIF